MFPFVREAVQRGYVIITPDYRGSTGHGAAHYEAIDYGGKEVDDAISAVDYLKTLPYVDMNRLGMMGWSHGGFITAHSLFRDDHPFKAGAAIVPVTNLVFRLSYKGPSYQDDFAAEEGIQGLPFEKREEYIKRSPVFHAANLKVPILVHVATNDEDVNYVEDQQMVYTLRAPQARVGRDEDLREPGALGLVGGARVQPPCGSRHARARGLAGADRLVESDVDVLRVESSALGGSLEATAAGADGAVTRSAHDRGRHLSRLHHAPAPAR